MKRILLALAVALATASVPAIAGAETFVVTTYDDLPTAASACPGIPGFPCSLRTALWQNGDDGGGATIELPAGEYRLTGGGLDVQDPVTIEGRGPAGVTTIDAGGGVGIFNIFFAPATLRHLVLTGSVGGPAILAHNVKPLTLEDVIVANNAEQTDSGAGGLQLAGSDATISHSIFTKDTGGVAGAIQVDTSTLALSDSEVRESSALDVGENDGGALHVQSGSVTVARTRFHGNAAEHGGAIAIVPRTDAAVTVTDSTFDGNIATNGTGGAVFVQPAATSTAPARSFVGRSDTFLNNGAVVGGTFGGEPPRISLINSAIAGSGGSACATPGVASLGHNVADDASCGLAGPADRQRLNPLVGPIIDGLPTFDAETLIDSPLAGSPLIDAADASACSPTDQRGLARPQGAGCDIGAIEALQAPTPVPDVPPIITTTTPVPPVPTPVIPQAARTLALSHLDLSRAVIRTGATLTWTATQAGPVRFAIQRRSRGRWATKVRFTLAGRRGSNRHAFPRSVLHRLHAGTYQLVAAGSHTTFRYAPPKRGT
jgi:hypothetical protein